MINDMLTVHEAAEISGISVRTLQYYDKIGLLAPAAVTDAGYRLYDDETLRKLRQIMLFRELEFPLKEIMLIMDDKGFDAQKALTQQIELLKLRREHLDELIAYAEDIRKRGVEHIMTKKDFSVFDKSKLEEYAKRAREQWGGTAEYKESEERRKGRTEQTEGRLAEKMMDHFVRFGSLKDRDPADSEVQALVGELQGFITAHYYTCTDEILAGLGKMYASGGEFTENIDAAGGSGTAAFVCRAVEIFCKL